MKDDATSLDRLHDIVQPPPVSWWPLAPGWYVLGAIVACGIAWLLLRQWRKWQANAYRRAALRQLQSTDTSAAIAELLRRTALSVWPRASVATLTGSRWADWLTETSTDEMTAQVRSEIVSGIYQDSDETNDITALREYASNWISHHRLLNQPDSI